MNGEHLLSQCYSVIISENFFVCSNSFDVPVMNSMVFGLNDFMHISTNEIRLNRNGGKKVPNSKKNEFKK